MKLRFASWRLVAPIAAFSLAGCFAGTGLSPDDEPGSSSAYTPPLKLASVDAGMTVPPPAEDAKRVQALARATASRIGTNRGDPFALTPPETNFERQQTTERLFGNMGSFTVDFAPPANQEPTNIQMEQQPYRRLSGIIVGDSVLAIIEMGNGQTEIIRPGMTIPGTSWRVKSIDADKAVLVRNGNVEPKQIIVRLESPPPGMGPTTPPSTGGRPGGPGAPGGFPGAPGGFPGGPPGGFPGRGGPGGRGGLGGAD